MSFRMKPAVSMAPFLSYSLILNACSSSSSSTSSVDGRQPESGTQGSQNGAASLRRYLIHSNAVPAVQSNAVSTACALRIEAMRTCSENGL